MMFKASDAKKLYDEAVAEATSSESVDRRVREILTTIRSVVSAGEMCVYTPHITKSKVVDKLRGLGYVVSESGGGSFIKINWK